MQRSVARRPRRAGTLSGMTASTASDWTEHAPRRSPRPATAPAPPARGDRGDRRAGCCVTAREIADLLRERGSSVGLASIYRALDLLDRHGPGPALRGRRGRRPLRARLPERRAPPPHRLRQLRRRSSRSRTRALEQRDRRLSGRVDFAVERARRDPARRVPGLQRHALSPRLKRLRSPLRPSTIVACWPRSTRCRSRRRSPRARACRPRAPRRPRRRSRAPPPPRASGSSELSGKIAFTPSRSICSTSSCVSFGRRLGLRSTATGSARRSPRGRSGPRSSRARRGW